MLGILLPSYILSLHFFSVAFTDTFTGYKANICSAQGRIGILQVHARDKELEDGIDFHKIARATAGSTGAELMNLMNQSAIVTVRQGRDKITQADIFEVKTPLTDQGYPVHRPRAPCL